MNHTYSTKGLLSGLLVCLLCIACSPVTEADGALVEVAGHQRLFIVGQDLGSIRAYYDSACCVKPDGNTAYINANWDAQSRWGTPHNQGYWGDSRLEANPEIARRFNLAITDWRGR